MPTTTSIIPYRAEVLVETTGITRDAWLSYRRLGVGGSDAAAAMGFSPWKTARDLYYEKLNIVSAIDDETNWVQLQVGILLEPLVAQIFSKRTGLEVYQINKMFVNPDHDFMLADVDYFVNMPDGTTAILECKTTNYNAKDAWWDEEGNKTVPFHYKLQGLHYMAVMGVPRVYFCCLYGNSEDEAIIRYVDRDMLAEEALIYCEELFWKRHVMARVPPPYTESGNLVMASVRKYYEYAPRNAAELVMSTNQSNAVECFLELQSQRQKIDAQSRALKNQMDQLKATVLEAMGQNCTAFYESGGVAVNVSYLPVTRASIKKEDLERMELNDPEIYKAYVTQTQERRFAVKVSKKKEVA